MPVTKTQMFIDILTYRTGPAARIEPVHLAHLAAVLGCRMLEFLHERAEGEVRHLSTPQTGHPCQLQVLHAERVVGTAKLVGELPLPVVTAIRDLLVDAVKGEPRRTAVRRASFAPGQTAGGLAQVAQSLPEEQRIINLRPVAQGEVGLQTEVHPDRCTIVCLSAGLRNRIGDDVQVVLAERTAPDPDLLDLSLPRTGIRELEVLLYGIQDKHVGVQLESALLVHDASELLGALKLRRSGRQVQKETLVRGIKPLQYLLDGLAVQTAAADTLCKMLLHCIQTDVSVKQTVVAFLKCEGVVPDKTGLAQHRIYLAVAL